MKLISIEQKFALEIVVYQLYQPQKSIYNKQLTSRERKMLVPKSLIYSQLRNNTKNVALTSAAARNFGIIQDYNERKNKKLINNVLCTDEQKFWVTSSRPSNFGDPLDTKTKVDNWFDENRFLGFSSTNLKRRFDSGLSKGKQTWEISIERTGNILGEWLFVSEWIRVHFCFIDSGTRKTRTMISKEPRSTCCRASSSAATCSV
ncbi:hypothetical protein FGO68_gene16311 [Halteria grandinella]|uniref:Uncharacterized protein n=1 Tax=Halteria grandinella TaxID=5974 RepID=A0A8J8T7V9_HALGN|nr:hypothetical protein FGO68_gene16311 [Halteria grandinella]